MIPNELQPLANHVWQSTLFAAATGLLVRAFRNNRAEIRYYLWLAASVKFLVPFSILVTLGSYFGKHSAAAPASPGFSFLIEQVNHPFTRTMPATSAAAGEPLVSTAMPAILGALWAIGFLILVSSWWRRWRQIRAALRTASPVRLPLGIEGMSSTAVIEPGVFGILRPVVLLPEGIASHLTAAEFEAILRHELCHIRRRDNLAAALHMMVEALFWFHPLVWWLGKRQLDERERACDEEVLRAGTQPEVYAEGILKICELYLKSPLACVAGVSGANLPKRIEAIVNHHGLPPLNVLKRLMLVVAGVAAVSGPIVVGLLTSPLIRAQSTQTAASKFEVAAIKRCEVGAQIRGPGPTPGRLSTPCVPLVSLMQSAYIAFAGGRPGPHFLSSVKILGGPAWIHSDGYQIEAKAEGNPGTGLINGPMLQALLEDRFKLKVHRETREIPVYALTTIKGGPKLRPFEEGNCEPRTNPALPVAAPGKKYCGPGPLMRNGANFIWDLRGVSMVEFSKMLDGMLDRPVLDKTGLTGKFDFHLEFAPDESTMPRLTGIGKADASPAPLAASGPSIFTAFQEQLGLRLSAIRGPGEFLVVDSAERPSAN